MTYDQIQAALWRAAQMLDEVGCDLTYSERDNIEVADFRLSELEQTRHEVAVYVNTERVCVKEIVTFPGQTCPEQPFGNSGSGTWTSKRGAHRPYRAWSSAHSSPVRDRVELLMGRRVSRQPHDRVRRRGSSR